MTKTLWIVRHGNRLDFVYPEWFEIATRRYDPPLAEDGFIQANKLALRLASEKIDHIFTSPFLRAIQTAYPVTEALDLPLKIEAGLSEWLNPDWMTENPETHPKEILERDYPRLDWSYQSSVIPQYPESEAQVKKRTQTTILKLVEKYPGNLLLVAHSMSVFGMSIGLVGGNPSLNLDLGCLVKIVSNREQWEIQLNGDTSYLDSD